MTNWDLSFKNYFHLFLARLDLRCCMGFPLVVRGRYCLVAVCGVLHCAGFSCGTQALGLQGFSR